jgi:hypothetical protein
MLKFSFTVFFSIALFFSAFSQMNAEGKLVSNDTVKLSVIRIFPDSFPNVSVIFKAETPSGESIWNLVDTSIKIVEDEKPCRIVSLEKVSKNKPVNTALVIDHSGSMRLDEIWQKWSNSLPPSAFTSSKTTMREYTDGEVNSDSVFEVKIAPDNPSWYHSPMWYAQHASLDYVSSVDSLKDPIAIVGFSENVDAVKPLTLDHATLRTTIDNLDPTGGTDFYDAVDQSLDLLQKTEGIKAVIALTDGKDNRSTKNLQEVIEKANKFLIPVFVIGLGDVNKSVLKKLAQKTGGTFYFTNDKKELSSIYLTISKQIQSIYEVVYESPSLNSADTSRDITLHFDIDGKYLDSRTLNVIVPEEVFTRLQEKEKQAAVSQVVPDNSNGNNLPYAAAGAVVLLASIGTIILIQSKKKSKKESQLLITNIFPNPTTGPITIQFQNDDQLSSSEFSIADSKGQVLLVTQNIPGSSSQEIDLSGFESGNYMIILKNATSSAPAKQVILSK